jgi:drug/metabolite transporter (DMT)-like permease
MSLIKFLLILVNTLTLVSGQFLWKFGLESNKNPFQSFYSLISLFLSPYVLSGLFLYGLATILWLFILTRVPLSVAYPIQSLAYILAIVGAYFVFGESITLYKVLGCIFIMIGVSFIGLTSSQ